MTDANGPIPGFPPVALDEHGRIIPMGEEEKAARADAFRRALDAIDAIDGDVPATPTSLTPDLLLTLIDVLLDHDASGALHDNESRDIFLAFLTTPAGSRLSLGYLKAALVSIRERDEEVARLRALVYAYPPNEPYAPDGETWRQACEAWAGQARALREKVAGLRSENARWSRLFDAFVVMGRKLAGDEHEEGKGDAS